jgi:hypothetical protein
MLGIWVDASETVAHVHNVLSLLGCLDTEMNIQAGKVGVSFAIISGEEVSTMQYGVVFVDHFLP